MAQGFGVDPGSPSNSVARAKVNGPSIGLMIVGGINVALGLLYLVQGVLALGGAAAPVLPPEMQQDADAMRMFEMIQNMSGPTNIVYGLVQLAVGGLIIFGGLKMRNLESRALAMTASIIAMVPCLSICCLLGLPFGIWSVVVLSSPEVKAAFH